MAVLLHWQAYHFIIPRLRMGMGMDGECTYIHYLLYGEAIMNLSDAVERWHTDRYVHLGN